MATNGYSTACDMLNIMRRKINENVDNKKTLINESVEDGTKESAIAITDDPKFGDKVLTNQMNQFLSSVDSGAQFTKPNAENPADSPLIYMPETGNMVFSGTIPSLNNLKWQFVLKNNTGDGCFMWADGLILNKENLMTLNKLMGFYSNWKTQWQTSAKELEQLANLA
jgi:hypothetical protein